MSGECGGGEIAASDVRMDDTVRHRRAPVERHRRKSIGCSVPLQTFAPDGRRVDSEVGVIPLFIQLEPRVFQIVGTGFYIASYGLLLTAKHVVDSVAAHDQEGRRTVTWLWKNDGTVNVRPIITCSYDPRAPRDAPDIAICQAVDSAKPGNIRVAQVNERIALVTEIPRPGTRLATYAFPDNSRVDFSEPERSGRVFADAFEGNVLEVVSPQGGFLRYTHLNTSIEIRGGASGGPVFGPNGHVYAVNCRGWDLASDEAVEPLSSVVPVSLILDLRFAYPYIPAGSAEEQAVPAERRGGQVTLRELAAWGHISVDP